MPLQLNRSDNKFEVARQKILKYHFSAGQNNIQDIVNMDMKALPRVISWIGRDVDGFSLLYQFVQSAPSLFGCDGKSKAFSGKRKWGFW